MSCLTSNFSTNMLEIHIFFTSHGSISVSKALHGDNTSIGKNEKQQQHELFRIFSYNNFKVNLILGIYFCYFEHVETDIDGKIGKQFSYKKAPSSYISLLLPYLNSNTHFKWITFRNVLEIMCRLFSTMEDFQHCGGYHQYCREYHQVFVRIPSLTVKGLPSVHWRMLEINDSATRTPSNHDILLATYHSS